ncbi:unnamed protein product [Bursaphelenchus xylophilus]|uniref:(pine wood nematode) hypothetical protein n=1 Tax=Bursaphelenchus xylophilus TaxID=6326 RepID=A0A1I7S032_BURXY|nr:unnamed protein product [Bursaphelenchus xylophilus]CAG9109052.1 unnamed protein product [Bursaphelenchus xylophilus]
MSEIQVPPSEGLSYNVFTAEDEYNEKLAQAENAEMMDRMRAAACVRELTGNLTQEYNPSEIFCHVPGRLTLLTTGTRYQVSLGEIERRIYGPECLNASFLSGILRKAKNKNVGKELRDKLSRKGLELQPGRRKSASPTCFTALVEAEARQMAIDFGDLINTYYPQDHAAAYLLDSVPSQYSQESVRNELIAARMIIRRLIDFHIREDIAAQYTESMDFPMSDFSNMTHKFGSKAFNYVMIAIDQILDTAMRTNINRIPEEDMQGGSESAPQMTMSCVPVNADEVTQSGDQGSPGALPSVNSQGRQKVNDFSPKFGPLPREPVSPQCLPAFGRSRIFGDPAIQRMMANQFHNIDERTGAVYYSGSQNAFAIPREAHSQTNKSPPTVRRCENMRAATSMKKVNSKMNQNAEQQLQRKRAFSENVHEITFKKSFSLKAPVSPKSTQLVVHQHLHRGRDGFRYIREPYILLEDGGFQSAPSTVNFSPHSSSSTICLGESPEKESVVWRGMDHLPVENEANLPESSKEVQSYADFDSEKDGDVEEGEQSTEVLNDTSPLQPVEYQEKEQTLNSLKSDNPDESQLVADAFFDPLGFDEEDRNNENREKSLEFEQELIEKGGESPFLDRGEMEPGMAIMENNSSQELPTADSEIYFM